MRLALARCTVYNRQYTFVCFYICLDRHADFTLVEVLSVIAAHLINTDVSELLYV